MVFRITKKFFALFVLLLLFQGAVPGLVRASTADESDLSALRSASSQADPIVTDFDQLKNYECWPLDIVLLVDQSSSMHSWHPYDAPQDEKTPPNDPDNYRFIAARRLLTLLITNRRAQCPEAVHRFGMITFGHEARDFLPLVSIDISQQGDRETWVQPYEDKIAEAVEDTNQKSTNFRVAFEAAEQMFEQASDLKSPENYGPRRKVVILLTDGNPAGLISPRESVSDHMCGLIDNLSSGDWQDYSVWVVALNAGKPYLDNDGCNARIRDDWEEITQSHDGQLMTLDYNEQLIPFTMKEIIDKEFGQPGIKINCGQPFPVEPYLNSIRFTFQKNLEDEDKPVILSKLDDASDEESAVLYQFKEGQAVIPVPNESPMQMLEDRYLNRDLAEEYVFTRPAPGRWVFTVEGLDPKDCALRVEAVANPDVSVNLVAQTIIIPENEDFPYYNEESPINLELALSYVETGEPVIVIDEERYPLTVLAQVNPRSGTRTMPNGEAFPEYQLFQQSDGLWASEQALVAPEEGIYDVEVHGYSQSDLNETYGVFTETVSYEVIDLEHLSFSIVSPDTGEVLPCNTIQEKTSSGAPVPVKVQLEDESDQPADAGFYLLSEPGNSFQAQLYNSSDTLLDTINLSPGEQTGTFEGVLWQDRKEVVGCGNAQVKVTFIGEYDQRRFVIPQATRTVPIKRSLSMGVLVSITQPTEGQTVTLHPDLMAASFFNEELSPVTLNFKITDLDQEPLDLSEVAKNAPENLYTVRLVGPNPELWEELSVSSKELVDGEVLAASGGLEVTEPGSYYFEIRPNPDAFQEGYIPADEIVRLSFSREDTMWTSPSTFNTLFAITVGILLAVIAIATYLLTGGPGGRLVIADISNPDDEIVGFSLSKRRFIKLRGRKLQAHGLKSIRVRKTESMSLDGGKAISVVVKDENDIEVYNAILEKDQPQMLDPNHYIIYR
jgi:hypothetical protein